MKIRKLVILIILLSCCTLTILANDTTNTHKKRIKLEKKDYIPKVHGTVRAKYEYSPQLNSNRFQVRNARVSLTGKVHQMVSYKAEIDLSDQGKLKMLDAFVKVTPVSGLDLTLGQMKMPFSTDNIRSPHNQFFANRAFIPKQMTGLRDVGFSIGYNAKKYFPIEFIAGVYNGNGLTNQKDWEKYFNYSARIIFTTCKYFTFDINWQSVHPENMRMNMFDANLRADFFGVHLETEGLYKIFPDKKIKPAYGFIGMASYDIKLPKVFDKLRILTRYDMMSNDNQGIHTKLDNGEIGDYVITFGRQRITAGVSLSIVKPFFAELRVNYEKYFYKDWSLANDSEKDKLVIEIVARF